MYLTFYFAWAMINEIKKLKWRNTGNMYIYMYMYVPNVIYI